MLTEGSWWRARFSEADTEPAQTASLLGAALYAATAERAQATAAAAAIVADAAMAAATTAAASATAIEHEVGTAAAAVLALADETAQELARINVPGPRTPYSRRMRRLSSPRRKAVTSDRTRRRHRRGSRQVNGTEPTRHRRGTSADDCPGIGVGEGCTGGWRRRGYRGLPGKRCVGISSRGNVARPPRVLTVFVSTQCPQTLPRSSANAGEGQWKLDVSVTCGFTLTSKPEWRWCEPRCEPDTALITQRSQVQILPPQAGQPWCLGRRCGRSR
jgi:hypothetical protein